MLIVFLVIVLDLIGFGIMVPILAYYVVQLGGGPELATFCMALYAIGMFISTPILGRLSDYYGRRPILMLSMLLGVYSSAGTLGRVVGTLVTGVIFARVHIESPYVTTVVLMFCLFLLLRSVQSHWLEHRG